MSYNILADTFSVARDSNHFVQIKTLKNPRSEDQIWATFKIEGDSKYARSTMQSLLETLDEVFFDNFELDAYERFENALKEVNLTYKTLQEKRGAHSMGTVSAIIAVISGNQLHLTQTDQAEAYLVRKTKLSLISEGLSGRSPDLFVNIASGELMPEDKIIFSTSRLLRLATHSQLAQMCSEGVVEALDALRELVLSESELSIGIACLNTKLAHRGARPQNPYAKGAVVTEWFKGLWDKSMKFVDKKTEGKKLPMEKSNILIGLGILILFLILSVTFLINNRHDSQLRDEYKLRIEKLRDEISSANTKGYANDKETANAILDKVEEEAQSILETEYYRNEVLSLLKKVQSTRDSINNAERLGALEPYADLSAKRENVEALGLMGLDGNLFAYEYNALYKVVMDQVMEPKTIDTTEVVIKATAMKDQNVLAFLTQSGRVIEYAEEEIRFASTADEVWKSGVDLAAYNNFIYLLSPKNNQIYKYTRQRDGYSAASEYNLNADLKDATSIAIDGNIYILKSTGEIIKIFKGEQQDFKIEDLGIDLKDAKDISTLPDQKNLYVFDPKNKRVVVLEKEVEEGVARYKKQIYFDEIEDIQSFYVSDDEKKLYLLSKKSIYETDL